MRLVDGHIFVYHNGKCMTSHFEKKRTEFDLKFVSTDWD